MIRSLTIKNFQSHKDTSIEFHEGVNVLIGQSDSGKTAILRALNWIINNRPSGDSFRSDWGGDTEVALQLNDKDEVAQRLITRVKSGKENYYTIQAVVLKAMGQGVPSEVESILNMSALNIQYQMDAPFLLSMTEGQVAQYLNEIAKLDVIDRAITAINSKVKRLNVNLTSEKARLEDTQTKLTSMDYIDAMDKKVKRIEIWALTVTSVRSEEQALNNLVVEIESIKEEKSKLKHIEDAERRYKVLVKLDKEAETLWLEAEDIQKALNFIDNANLSLKKYANMTKAKVVVGDLLADTDAIDELEKEWSEIVSLVEFIQSLEDELSKYAKYPRAFRLLDRLITFNTSARVMKHEAVLIIQQLDEIDEQNNKVKAVDIGLLNMNKWWEKNAPKVCPLCDGKGKLK